MGPLVDCNYTIGVEKAVAVKRAGLDDEFGDQPSEPHSWVHKKSLVHAVEVDVLVVVVAAAAAVAAYASYC